MIGILLKHLTTQLNFRETKLNNMQGGKCTFLWGKSPNKNYMYLNSELGNSSEIMYIKGFESEKQT